MHGRVIYVPQHVPNPPAWLQEEYQRATSQALQKATQQGFAADTLLCSADSLWLVPAVAFNLFFVDFFMLSIFSYPMVSIDANRTAISKSLPIPENKG